MNERIHTLAEEAGLYCDGTPDAWDQEAIERFAALVAAHVEPCCQEFDKCQKICMPRAAAAEREACARLCEEHKALRLAEMIRAGDGEPGTYCHTYYHIETGACIQHGEWARTAGLGCPGCNGEIEKYQEELRSYAIN